MKRIQKRERKNCTWIKKYKWIKKMFKNKK